ncbi:MAG: hypothetical protein NTX25_22825, partial [Proteobacteria bacterium]|nr:hypothetical protein [Pseudomonadota bacterium]
FINTARAKDPKNIVKPKELDTLDFQKAWKRLVNVIRDPENSSFSPNLTFEDKVKVAVRQKKITMILPVDVDSRITTRFPTQLPLVWVNPLEDTQDFKVYLCKYTEKMDEPVAIVHGDSYALTITEPGSYLVRVTSLDQRFASKTHMVHILEETPDIMLAPRIDKNEHKLVFPPHNFVYQTDVLPANLMFIGSISLLKRKTNMALHIAPMLGDEGKLGKENSYPLTADFAMTLTLPAGPYQWWIEYDSWSKSTGKESGHEAVKIEKLKSENRFLHVLAKKPTQQNVPDTLSALLEESMATGTTAQLYLASP